MVKVYSNPTQSSLTLFNFTEHNAVKYRVKYQCHVICVVYYSVVQRNMV